MNKTSIIICFFFIGLITFACTDPRKNCNHPKHAEYIKEKQLKKQGIKLK